MNSFIGGHNWHILSHPAKTKALLTHTQVKEDTDETNLVYPSW